MWTKLKFCLFSSSSSSSSNIRFFFFFLFHFPADRIAGEGGLISSPAKQQRTIGHAWSSSPGRPSSVATVGLRTSDDREREDSGERGSLPWSPGGRRRWAKPSPARRSTTPKAGRRVRSGRERDIGERERPEERERKKRKGREREFEALFI